MRRYIILAVMVLALTMTSLAWGSSTNDSRHNNRQDVSAIVRQPVPDNCTVQALRPFAAKVWNTTLWERGKPSGSVLRAYSKRLGCAPVSHKRAMRKTWHRAQKKYFVYRSDALWRQRVTPYYGGGRYWAIPYYIVACESGGDYNAQNPTSTAYGAYQMLDSTYASYCRACDGSERDQDLAAHRLYVTAGAGPWECG